MSKIKSMRIHRSCRVISSEPSERSSKSRGPQSVLLFLGFLSRMASRLLFGALGFRVLEFRGFGFREDKQAFERVWGLVVRRFGRLLPEGPWGLLACREQHLEFKPYP